MAISEPINPIAAHLGGGVLQLYTEPPVSGTLDHYELQCSFNEAGPYRGYSNRFFSRRDAYIYGFAIGLTVYVRIRAVGADGSVSDWVQVGRGVLGQPLVGAVCRCIKGSIIPEGAVFSVAKKPDRIVGLRALAQVNF